MNNMSAENTSLNRVLIIGAGLAGSEAAYFLANKGIKVTLLESKEIAPNQAQKITTCAELVCTNSLKSKNSASAHGILKYEMQKMGSLVLKSAYENEVPAGDALAVDRVKFSQTITDNLKQHQLIEYVSCEASDPLELQKKYACDLVILATGPLTTKSLESWIQKEVTADDLYFYDAIAPVVDSDTLDFSKLYFKDRYTAVSEVEGETADYLNAPLDKETYENFITAMVQAEKVPAKSFESYKFFESCLPIDVMAERGMETARFSCMKPVGLEMEDGKIPYACVQLRRENLLGSAFNLVGFQTRLTYGEQKKILKMIPGFENAEFLHFGSIHRNTFLNARKYLNADMSSKKYQQIYFAGQITGVEGYTESAASGLFVAMNIYQKYFEGKELNLPITTGLGALINYIMTSTTPAPSNLNFGLFPVIDVPKAKKSVRKKLKKELIAKRANKDFDEYFSSEL